MEDDDRNKKKWRKCLKCQKKFRSTSVSNRICGKCRGTLRTANRREIPTMSPTEEDIQEDPLI